MNLRPFDTYDRDISLNFKFNVHMYMYPDFAYGIAYGLVGTS